MNERKCPECGEIVTTNIDACPKCGCPLPKVEKEVRPQYISPNPSVASGAGEATVKKARPTSKAAIAGLIMGIIIFMAGFTMMGHAVEDNIHTAGNYAVPYSAFGGDFYTEIYAANDTMADALTDIDSGVESLSRSTQTLVEAVYTCSGMLVMAIGLMTVAVSLPKIKKA